MNKFSFSAFTISIALVSNVAFCTEIPASNFFLKSESVIKIQVSPNDVVVFDQLENEKYFLNGRDMILTADNIKIVGNVVIAGYKSAAIGGGGEGSPGPNGASLGQASNCRTGIPGGNGERGGEGPAGSSGLSGSVIKLDIGAITGPGVIKFENSGQNGGPGGKGGRGGDGGHGEQGGQSKSTWKGCECGGADGGPGGNGGSGGIGGIGGDGGSGGTIVLSPRTSQVRQRLDFNVSGGKGGAGGPVGNPGNGGTGGSGGRGGGLCGGGGTAGNGSLGGNGASGRAGTDGKQGVIVEW